MLRFFDRTRIGLDIALGLVHFHSAHSVSRTDPSENLQHCRTRTFGTALARALARGTAVKQSAHSYGPGECADSVADVIRPRTRPAAVTQV